MIDFEELMVKEVVKITKDKKDGREVQFKTVLEHKKEPIKITISSDTPLKLNTNEKGIKVTIYNPQTSLVADVEKFKKEFPELKEVSIK